jgi:hypothetical protein
MEASIPFYPLIVLPVAATIFLFWRRARWHLAVLRTGRPLDRSDRIGQRIWSIVVYVLGQKRLLQDLGPGLAHAFVFWGFIVLLATTMLARQHRNGERRTGERHGGQQRGTRCGWAGKAQGVRCACVERRQG